MNEETSAAKSNFPTKTVIWTIFAAIVIAIFFQKSFYFNEQFGIDPAILSLSMTLLAVITTINWSFWAFFYAKHRLVGLFIFLSPIAFLCFFQPNVDGDMHFSGFVPRFWNRNVEYVETTDDALTNSGINLQIETPEDFPQFLGPKRDGQFNNVNLANSWSSPPLELWKIGMGEGWSGFVAVNGYAITQEQRGADECVTCYDIETGTLVWKHAVKRRHEDPMGIGKVGPRATPTVNEGMVYTLGGTGILDCVNGSTGQLEWSADVPELVSISKQLKTNNLGLDYTVEDSTLTWGRSNSPLIVDDKIVVPAGGTAENPARAVTLIAFNKKTGQEIWRGGNRMVSYGSPSLVTLGGQQQIVLVTESDAVGHDIETGEELWSHRWYGMSSSAANCSQVTYVDDSHVLLSKGYNQGGELISVTKNSDGEWRTESLKKDPRLLKTKFTNPVIYQKHAYSLSDGYLECTEVTSDGDSFNRKWKQRGRFGHGQLLLVGDKLLVHSESGTLFLIKADPSGYTELEKFKTIDGLCWNTICLYGNKVLLRSEIQAACYELPLTNPVETENVDSNVLKPEPQ